MFEQGHTSRFGELGVQTKYLDREGDLVDYSLAGRLSLRPEFKIAGAIIVAVTVFVMNLFVGQQRATEYFFHHVSMLVHLDAASTVEAAVSRRDEVASFRNGSPFATSVTALGAAKAIFVAEAGKATVSVFQAFALCGCTTICTLESGRVHTFGHVGLYTERGVLVKEFV